MVDVNVGLREISPYLWLRD